MFWDKKHLTVLDLIDRELKRLHEQLDRISEVNDSTKEIYFCIVNQIDLLNKRVISITEELQDEEG